MPYGEEEMETGVTGLSDREDGGEGEVEALERVDEMEGGRADMTLGEEIRLGEASWSGFKTIWEGMVLRWGIERSERDLGRRTVDQKGPVDEVGVVRE